MKIEVSSNIYKKSEDSRLDYFLALMHYEVFNCCSNAPCISELEMEMALTFSDKRHYEIGLLHPFRC